MKLTQKLATFFILFPLTAFAADQATIASSGALKSGSVSRAGTNSGGGGEPQDLEDFEISDKMKSILTTLDKNTVWLKGEDYPVGLTSDQEERLRQLKNVQSWFQYAAKTYKVLSVIDYPFVHAEYRDDRLKIITDSIDEITFVHGSELSIDGGRVTFISNPTTRTVQVDYARFSKFFGTKDRWIPQDEVKPMAIKMLTIAMHEFMVLQKLERSRTYNTSSEFGELLTLTFSGNLFWRWAMQNLSFFKACPYVKDDASTRTYKSDIVFVANYLYREGQMKSAASSEYNLKGPKAFFGDWPPTRLERLLMAEIYSGVQGARVAIEHQFMQNVSQKCSK